MFKWTTHDGLEYRKEWFITPIGPPVGGRKEQRFRTPGCCVKSKQCHDDGWAIAFGVLSQYEPEADKAVVISHVQDGDPRGVWRGTVREYMQTWEID